MTSARTLEQLGGQPAGAAAAGRAEIHARLDDQLRVIEISDITRTLLGIPQEGDDVVGSSGFDNVHPSDLQRAAGALELAMDSPGSAVSVRLRARPLVGRWRVLDLEVTREATGFLVEGADVTLAHYGEIASHLELELFDRVPVALVVTDDAGVIVLWNRRASLLYGYPGEDALGQDVHSLQITIDDGMMVEKRAALGRDGRWEGETQVRRRDGSFVSILSTLERLEAPEIGFHGMVTAAIDNTERQVLQEALAHQAMHDPLTGLPNRALFLDRLEHAMARVPRNGGTVAVLFADLDRFKLVNDSCGHQAGDEVLRSVAELFSAVLRPEDTIARLGGDEFAICCELTDPADALAVAERLTMALSAPFGVSGREFYVSPSIGIVLGSGAQGETAATLLRDADAAMYCAKERGRNRVEVFDSGMRSAVLRRAEVATELRQGLQRDEFVLHYQPVVRLTDGELVGFEALLRWQHPTRGLLAPGDFMDVAEDTNLIVPIGAWVLDAAAAQMARWMDELPERQLVVNVNLSARQVADPGLVGLVREALDRNQLAGARLCLEITESILMEDAEGSVATLRELKALGVGLAIDDFGTGYSSLTYLKRFPVDFLKIDRSFVGAVDRDSEDAVIVKAVLELGRALGLGVVAEGVETAGQLAELRRLGCEVAQGFLWAPGQDPPDALALATAWQPHPATTRSATPADEPALLTTGELLSVLTHELVTPLTIVKGQCERLAPVVADLPHDVAGVLAVIGRNADRIEHLVATLGDAQQLEAGTIVVRPTPFDLVELARDVIETAVPEEREVRLAGVAVVPVEADGRRLEQILVNLLTNAHKFSPAGTPVTVSIEADEADVTVVVADEGPGVPPERVADIFRKFARLQRNKKGVGLGLFISRQLARAHGGDLHYRRAVGGGSELVLTLPRRTQAPARRSER